MAKAKEFVRRQESPEESPEESRALSQEGREGWRACSL
jgi:hypothetical protein